MLSRLCYVMRVGHGVLDVCVEYIYNRCGWCVVCGLVWRVVVCCIRSGVGCYVYGRCGAVCGV